MDIQPRGVKWQRSDADSIIGWNALKADIRMPSITCTTAVHIIGTGNTSGNIDSHLPWIIKQRRAPAYPSEEITEISALSSGVDSEMGCL